MAEKGKDIVEETNSSTYFSPVVSPLVKNMSNDQLMEIADDVDVFAQFCQRMKKTSSATGSLEEDKWFTPPTTTMRATLRPLTLSPLPLLPSDQQEPEPLNLKEYLMVNQGYQKWLF